MIADLNFIWPSANLFASKSGKIYTFKYTRSNQWLVGLSGLKTGDVDRRRWRLKTETKLLRFWKIIEATKQLQVLLRVGWRPLRRWFPLWPRPERWGKSKPSSKSNHVNAGVCKGCIDLNQRVKICIVCTSLMHQIAKLIADVQVSQNTVYELELRGRGNHGKFSF